MKALLARIKNMLVETWQVGDRVGRSKAVEAIESEVEEMENIFGILVLGSFVGMPSPPMQISLDLMPYMEKELILMLQKVDTASEPISQLFSIFNIG
jgi:hypothetical protein